MLLLAASHVHAPLRWAAERPHSAGLAESFHGRPIVLPRWSAAARRHHRRRGATTAAGASPVAPNPNQAHLQVDLAFLMLLHHSQATGMASSRRIELPSTSSVPTRVKDLGLEFKRV